MLDFFTDPWKIELARWTMFEISSALLQLGVGYFVISVGLLVWLKK